VAHTHRNESYQTWWNLIIDFLGFYKKNKKFEQTLHFWDLPAQGPPPPVKICQLAAARAGREIGGRGAGGRSWQQKSGGQRAAGNHATRARPLSHCHIVNRK